MRSHLIELATGTRSPKKRQCRGGQRRGRLGRRTAAQAVADRDQHRRGRSGRGPDLQSRAPAPGKQDSAAEPVTSGAACGKPHRGDTIGHGRYRRELERQQCPGGGRDAHVDRPITEALGDRRRRTPSRARSRPPRSATGSPRPCTLRGEHQLARRPHAPYTPLASPRSLSTLSLQVALDLKQAISGVRGRFTGRDRSDEASARLGGRCGSFSSAVGVLGSVPDGNPGCGRCGWAWCDAI
jgi:hypothetical protein